MWRLQVNDSYNFYVEFAGMSNEMLSHFTQGQIQPIV